MHNSALSVTVYSNGVPVRRSHSCSTCIVSLPFVQTTGTNLQIAGTYLELGVTPDLTSMFLTPKAGTDQLYVTGTPVDRAQG